MIGGARRVTSALTGCVLAAGALAALAQDLPARPVMTLAAARQVVEAAIAAARTRGAPGGAIAVVDAGGQVVLLERLDGTFPAAPDISVGKARTAAMFRRPTRQLEDAVNKGRFTMVALPAVAPFTPLQGGVPLLAGETVVGAVGVSGAASAQQDDEIAQAAADTFSGGRHAANVEYRPADEVRDAFARGLPLIDDGAFKVNASRRDGPGEAEVHLRDTDIFYVLDGSAEFVTGGALVEPRDVADGERRGSAIRDGATWRLAAGDVITVPRGTPHWFARVDAPLVYYVVKTTFPEG
jgi:glc operon protein GlcG